MIFTLGTYSVEFERPSQFPVRHNRQLVQARDKSASGITHIESFEVETNEITLNFRNMSESDYQLLVNWFIATSEGMLNEFDLTDDLGVTRTVRFTSSTLNFSKNSFGHWDGSFTVEHIQ